VASNPDGVEVVVAEVVEPVQEAVVVVETTMTMMMKAVPFPPPDQDSLQCQLQMLLNDQRQTA